MFAILVIAAVTIGVYIAIEHHVRLATVEAAIRAVPAELKALEERAAAEAKKL